MHYRPRVTYTAYNRPDAIAYVQATLGHSAPGEFNIDAIVDRCYALNDDRWDFDLLDAKSYWHVVADNVR